ncbi:cytochrome oxidase putative small subunit CydP [Duganella qianjiadongensis]|uniref:cytochrome oxidase putative small subunit CydP n=1 Tax=Duganella qianjiadongensis TaxID=2692176 RepID=UPI0019275D0F|nr:cytochrome oxidase putative small subunit CydP [Duganella qianjiadongensis]
MRHPDHRLLRHLIIAVLVKLVLLTGLWWAFVRDARVEVDTTAVARHLGGPLATTGEKQ